jgi:hypothetical protein
MKNETGRIELPVRTGDELRPDRPASSGAIVIDYGA